MGRTARREARDVSACYEALVPVGKDCDCGHPMIWMRGQQRCAVYGSHPTTADPVRFRNLHAPGAELVRLVLANTWKRGAA